MKLMKTQMTVCNQSVEIRPTCIQKMFQRKNDWTMKIYIYIFFMWLWSFYIVKVFRKTSCMANTTFQNSLTWPSQRCCCPLWHHRANEKPFLTIPKIQNTAKFWLETQILKVLKCKILKVFDLWVSCVQDRTGVQVGLLTPAIRRNNRKT